MIVGGVVRVPGDKSITHRALMLAAMARGQSHIGGALTSLDTRATAAALRRLGANVTALREASTVIVHGRGRLRRPAAPIHCANSGTSARLLTGLLAAHRFTATITGDRSLRRRPMRRVTEPLAAMGATFRSAVDGLPLEVRGSALQPLRWELPVSSAQLKSALLFAGVAGRVEVSVREPAGRSRDHTERMLRGLGFDVAERDGWIELAAGAAVPPFELQVPGDLSSAAFLVGAALLANGGELTLAGVGVNPTRTGMLSVIARMGASVAVEPLGDECGEPVGDLIVQPSALRATAIDANEIPGLIDEIPLLAVLASRATGTTVFHEVGELRVKESDRLTLIAANLRAVGARAEASANRLTVAGSDEPPRGRVRTAGDHRIAMAFAVLATVDGARVTIDDMHCAAVSYPGFTAAMRGIRARRTR